MIVGLVAALGAAGCYGFASIFQASAAHGHTSAAHGHTSAAHTPAAHGHTSAAPPVDTGLSSLVQLVSRWRYLCGLGLDAVGFLAAFTALQTLPLFVVQSAIAGSIAVTAIAAHLVLGVELQRRDWRALGIVMAGLVLLGAAGRPEHASRLDPPGPMLVLLAAGVVAIAALALTSRPRAPSGALAFLAGGSFAGVGISARAIDIPHTLGDAISDPLLYALGGFGLLGIVVFAAALQRSSVISVTTITLAVETVIPAGVGIAFLGDHTRSGFAAVAVVGFILTVLGSIGLARST